MSEQAVALSGAPKVSVVVPVYNPGSHMDDCVRSLLEQTLPAQDYEVIFVDDGSTDDTPARLDALAARHDHVRVEHISNSGWPGRPRNIGLEMARGDFVYFVDNDDWVGAEALERLHATAVRDEADIVVGKVVGHGKPVPHELFRENRSGVDLGWTPLLWLLTPHKLFRRRFLDEHGLRFPEGRRRLEDHAFVVHAYLHTKRVSVLADYPCYHWVVRGEEINASSRLFDPLTYYQNVREVLDIVDEHTSAGEFRDRLYARWYWGKLLGRVGGTTLLNREPDARRARYGEIRRLTAERFGWAIDRFLPYNLKLRSILLREGAYGSLEALAEWESRLRANLALVAARRDRGDLSLSLQAELQGEDGALRFERRGEAVTWAPPQPLSRAVAAGRLDAKDAVAASTVNVFLRSLDTEAEYLVPTEVGVRLVPDEATGALRPAMTVEARISAATGAAGARLPPGHYGVLGTITLAGFKATGRPRRTPTADGLVVTVSAEGAVTERRPTWRRRVGRIMPWLVRPVRVVTRRAGDRALTRGSHPPAAAGPEASRT